MGALFGDASAGVIFTLISEVVLSEHPGFLYSGCRSARKLKLASA